MVVDDSAVIRGVLTRWLEEEPTIKVVASAQNGLIALRLLEQNPVDVVILDIEMPEMDGMTALPLLINASPYLQVIMASTLTLRNADISLKALGLGAVDYLPKPQNTKIVSGFDFRRELVEKVKAFGAVAHTKRGMRPAARTTPQTVAKTREPVADRLVVAPTQLRTAAPTPTATRTSKRKPSVLAIGSSTGGPQALFEVLGALPQPFALPILITQHMPVTFTTILAQHIERATGFRAREAVDGESLISGRVYVAPGDWHMTVAGTATQPRLKLDQSPQVNFCRPAVDPLFASLAKLYGPAVLGVVLTGMGHDGRDGAGTIVQAGGTVIVQDAETSVVWGMPGSVANAGFAAAVLPLKQIAPNIMKYLNGVGS
jgi:two-component system, chemotaxis family, protein-glutamate methylesterase/glutaminase